jgi:hypothetical protein
VQAVTAGFQQQQQQQQQQQGRPLLFLDLRQLCAADDAMPVQ